MRQIETDYLVVGAGASGIGFVDSLIANSDADVVMVDRRERPGGHWLNAYPFVRVHQPSANYGVNSRVLGNDRIDESGPNAGFYERATGAEVCKYYDDVFEQVLLPSGQVRFFGKSDYLGEGPDGHQFVSLTTGEETTVKVRRKLVDATYVESSIPSTHTPAYEVDEGIRLIPPNDLVDLDGTAAVYTVIGAGKTAMDTCNFLMDEGVAPDKIRWIRTCDAWTMDRVCMQPLELVGSYMQLQASWVKASAEAESGEDFARRLEADGAFMRLDPNVEPLAYRGALLSRLELESLRQIDNVVRLGRVLRIGTDRVTLEQGSADTDGHVFVDCTAAGVRQTTVRPIFDGDRITMQVITLGIVPWGAAITGVVEALLEDDAEKNALCPPLVFTGRVADILEMSYAGMTGLMMRGAHRDIEAWNSASRLNPGRGAGKYISDPRVSAALTTIGTYFGDAMSNLEQRVRARSASSPR